jgi:selenocysteine-specific elongation factor
MQDFIVGTAGHIDHGKTTLLHALTGINADRLKEEQRRGITIDIGFAHLQLGDKRIGFVDVPGHEKFVKNMLAGIGGIQFVLLVIAADESVMPQTVEHFQICQLLEIPSGVIVLTKKNQVEEDLLPLVEEEVQALVVGSFLENAPVVAVDSLTGEGLEDLKESLVNSLETVKPTVLSVCDKQVFRFPIDRVFSLQGFGTVVTGTPSSGEYRTGQVIEAYPAGKRSKVRGIQVFGEQQERAMEGQRTALNLTSLNKEDLGRGMVLSEPGFFEPSHMLDVHIQLLKNSPAPLKDGAPVRFHHGSGEEVARLYLPGKEEMKPGSRGIAQLRFGSPVVVCPLDHFILRRYSPMTTIAGGIVLDNNPRKHGKKPPPSILEDLQEVVRLWHGGSSDTPKALIHYYIVQAGTEGLDLHQLGSRTGFTRKALQGILSEIEDISIVPQDPNLAVSSLAIQDLQEQIVGFIKRHHQKHPLSQGAAKEELKTQFMKRAKAGYFQYVMADLVERGIVDESGATVSLQGREVQLDSDQEEHIVRILEEFPTNRIQAPSITALEHKLGDPERTRTLIHHLLQNGRLVRITAELLLSTEQVEWMEKTLRERFSQGDGFSVADFKDLFGLSRKYAIPFLEFLDRRKVTRRVVNQRIIC